MASVRVDIELSEVDTRDLISELEDRYFNEFEFNDIIDMMYSDDDKLKMKFFFQIKDKYSLLELKEMFKESITSMPIPEEQLKLF